MYTNEESPWTFDPARRDVDTEITPDVGPEPLRRLEPGRICPQQQGDVVKEITRILP